MAEKDYSHRDITDKLGLKPGQAVKVLGQGDAELLKRARSKQVVILDTRPAREYVAGHIPGAISVPVDELKQRLQTLTKGKEYVAYCRGPYCVYADRAVELLKARGRRARRLLDGFPEWRAAGLPVARGVQPGALK